ncbi:unnamed protein product [Penicillium palitans]
MDDSNQWGSYHPDVPLHFLERSELYDTVKPYNFHYFPKQIFPLHNIKHDVQTVCVRSMRPLVSTLSIDTQGFEVHKLATEMTYEDFMDEDVVRSKYFKELECHLKEKLGAHEVRALDSQLRLKDAGFPAFGGKPHPKPQPSLMLHADVTLEASKSIIGDLYGDDAAGITNSRFQVITVWKPLSVPVRDWPLALCDASSIDPADFVPSDIIYPNYVAENLMLHYSSNQTWYWLPDQQPDEVLVFKAVDSDKRDNHRTSLRIL